MSVRSVFATILMPASVTSAVILGPAAVLGATQNVPAGPPPEPGEVDERAIRLTLEDAVRIAVSSNIGLEIEQENVEVRRLESLGIWGVFDPVLSASTSYTTAEFEGPTQLAGAAVVDEDSLSTSAGLLVPFHTGGALDVRYFRDQRETNSQFSAPETTRDIFALVLTQPLLRGAWSEAATSSQRQVEIAYLQQQELLRASRQQLVLDVHFAYWDLVTALEELQVRELAVRLGEEQLAQNRRRLEVGVGTEVDVLQAETNVATQSEQRLLAEVEVRAAMDALKALLFRRGEGESWRAYVDAWETTIEPLTPLPSLPQAPLELDWTRSLMLAAQYRPELVQQRLVIDAAETRLVLAESNSLPLLDARLEASSSGFAPKRLLVDPGPPPVFVSESNSDAFSDAIGFEFPTYVAALDFALPIGNRTAKYSERAARVDVRVARLAYEQVEMNIVAEVRGAVREVLYQAEAVAAAVRSVQLARRQLEAEQARYQEGLSTTFQVLEFQQTLAQALSSEKAARGGLAKAEAALQRAEGVLGGESVP